MSFEEEEEVVCRSGLNVSYGDKYGRNSLRGVYRDTILLLMSRMATSQLSHVSVAIQANLGVLLEEFDIKDSFWVR